MTAHQTPTPGTGPLASSPSIVLGAGLPARPAVPQYPLRHTAWLAFGMSVTTGAVGQVLFLGQVFGGGRVGYLAAAFIAAFAEIAMIASGDSALHHRVHRRAGWQLLMVLSMGIALLAAMLNLSHWATTNLSMAVMFAGASFVGWAIHIANGHIVATDVRQRLDVYDEAVDGQRRHAESLRRAEVERAFAEQQDPRTAVARVQTELSRTPLPARPSLNGQPLNGVPDGSLNGHRLNTAPGGHRAGTGTGHPVDDRSGGGRDESDGEPAGRGPAVRLVVSPQRDRAAEVAGQFRDERGSWPTVSELEALAEVSRGTAGAVLKNLRDGRLHTSDDPDTDLSDDDHAPDPDTTA